VDTGRAIRQARTSAGLSQTQLARRSGTSQATISAYEHGAKLPTPETLSRVLGAAGRRLISVPAAAPVYPPAPEELERRSRILSQVLDLAERLPFQPSRRQ
jgi:transcriptional regulator with XRE-family HTH domain